MLTALEQKMSLYAEWFHLTLKRCLSKPSDFTKFWVNLFILINENKWKNSEFTGLVNLD